MKVLDFIKDNFQKGKKLLAILVDPDDVENLQDLISRLRNHPPDIILVGGSIIKKSNFHDVVDALKLSNIAPVLLFPGDFSQVSFNADGVLLLSLISGRNPEYLINQHVKASMVIKEWGGEIIPTSYILIDGGNTTTVQKVSQTSPMKQNDLQSILATALAGQQLGQQISYLEAGSGAKINVDVGIIKAVRSELNIPIIVGGGIRNVQKAREVWVNGATIVVIGTAFENGDINLAELLSQRDELNK